MYLYRKQQQKRKHLAKQSSNDSPTIPTFNQLTVRDEQLQNIENIYYQRLQQEDETFYRNQSSEKLQLDKTLNQLDAENKSLHRLIAELSQTINTMNNKLEKVTTSPSLKPFFDNDVNFIVAQSLIETEFNPCGFQVAQPSYKELCDVVQVISSTHPMGIDVMFSYDTKTQKMKRRIYDPNGTGVIPEWNQAFSDSNIAKFNNGTTLNMLIHKNMCLKIHYKYINKKMLCIVYEFVSK